ncbi:MAG: murein L,D-transpeptidase [Sphingomonadales bacterium]|nr:murein L,D-transpeptidase [Sphingomonadales bacterium]
MRTLILATAVSALALSACNFADDSDASNEAVTTADNSDPLAPADWQPDPMASNDDASGDMAGIAQDDKPRPLMQAQVVLDRIGFAPGVVDGKMGMSTKNALTGFQTANDLKVTGELDEATKQALSQWSTISATRVVTVPEDFAAGEFSDLPDDPQEKAKLDRLGYESLAEKLAERFHTTVAVLKELNPGGTPAGMEKSADDAMTSSSKRSDQSGASDKKDDDSFFYAGQKLRVPNIGGDMIDPNSVKDAAWRDTLKMLGVGSEQPQAAKIVVDESDGVLRAFDKSGKLIAQFTATMGSKHDPLPLGDWGITGVAKNPPFNYNPELFWDADDSDKKAKLPPGPNGPVGVVWIDLTKEHYGIHGTPAPETIGRAQSHGCVRLTNWDAARLAQMVSTSTKVVFQA